MVARWWRENRPAAPTLFDDELKAAIDRLRSQPTHGIEYSTVDGGTFRRMVLPRSQQHLFYSVDTESSVVIVYTVWGARRGRGPRIP